MDQISGDDWATRFAASFDTVFSGRSPFAPVLRLGVPARALLFPVGYQLTRQEFNTFKEAALLLRESVFIVSPMEQAVDLRDPTAAHFVVGWDDYDGYRAIHDIAVLENALYSPSGQWGLLISHEQHALLGGTESFVAAILSRCTDWQSSLTDFQSFWQSSAVRFGVDIQWVDEVLNHLTPIPEG